mgnify:CR=1 FL=1
MGQNKEWQEKAEEFWSRVREAVAKDTGLRAVFRRNAGELLRTADGRAVAAFYRVYGGGLVSEWNEDRCFFAVCAACLWKPEDWSQAKPLAMGARALSPDDKATFEKRLRVLLDLPWDDDGYFAMKLCRLLKYCMSKNMVVDGNALMKDLIGWDSDERFVQKRWVRELYREQVKDEREGVENHVD